MTTTFAEPRSAQAPGIGYDYGLIIDGEEHAGSTGEIFESIDPSRSEERR